MTRTIPHPVLVAAARAIVSDYRSLRQVARLLECSTRTLAFIMGDCWIRPAKLGQVRLDILLQWVAPRRQA